MGGDKVKKKILKSVWIIMFVIAVGALVYEIIMIHNSYQQYKEVDDTNNEIISTYTKSTSESPTDDFSVDWEKLLSVNKDIIAWIRIPDTNINYLVVQGKSNSQYLRKNIYGNYSFGGCLFVDSSTQNPFENMNTIIYGHNMKNGSMFAGLKNYSDQSYAEAHPYIYVDLADGSHCYEIFSAHEADATDITYTIGYRANDTYASFLDSLKTASLYDTGVEVTKDDSVISLSTCTKSGEKRFVVHAKKLY